MKTINPGSPFTFNYPTPDHMTGLFVKAKVYDVSNGNPALIEDVVMSDIGSLGFYTGNFTGDNGKTYLVIVAVWEDEDFTTLDLDRAPVSDVYKSTDAPLGFAGLNYATYDHNEGLYIAANIYDVTTGTASFVQKLAMARVFTGVYFTSFIGVVDHVYEVYEPAYTSNSYNTIDTDRAPASESFQCFDVIPQIKNTMKRAILVGPPVNAIPASRRFTMDITQGDTPLFQFVAQNGEGEAVDLTGAVFTTLLRGENGAILSYPNSQHTANPDQVLFKGYFSLSMTEVQTNLIPPSQQKDVVTKAVFEDSSIIYFHGPNMLTVIPQLPEK